MCLCRLGRRVDKSPGEVLLGLLEKVFLDLQMLSKTDDLLDEPLGTIRARIGRFRKQPENLTRLLADRTEELLVLSEIFPEELDKSTVDLISRLYYKFYPPELSEMETPPPCIDTEVEQRVKNLVADLSPNLPNRYTKTFDRDEDPVKRKRRRRG